MKKIKCLRCDEQMSFIMSEKIQLGQTGWILGDISNLLAGAMEIDIYSCPKCAKIEFFQASNIDDSNRIAQKTCPKCGRTHDIDYPKCPSCKYDYNTK